MKHKFILPLLISAMLLSACNKDTQDTQENETVSGSVQETADTSGASGELSAKEVYMNFLGGDVSLLGSPELGQSWIDFYLPAGGMEYTFLDLDGDGESELLVQLVDDPSGLNAVFDYQDGRLICRNFDSVEMSSRDYPLSDGTMIHQYDFSGTRNYIGYRYLPDGTTEELFSLFARDELVYEGDTNPVPYYEVNGEEVDQETFEAELDKRITSQLLERSAWIAISYTADSGETDDTVKTASREELQIFKDSFEYPAISMGENSSPEEIMLAGKRAGKFFSREAEKYFGYGVEYKWKVDGTDERSTSGHGVCLGPYTDKENGIYFPMVGNEAKWFIINQLRLTERGFEELCLNSPSSYELDGDDLIVHSGDGGQAGWDYSYIVDYEMEGNTVTYNCLRVGTKEEWGYDEDVTEPFTFRLAYENGIWKLDGCSWGEGLFYYFIGLQSDADAYPEPAQEEQPYRILDLLDIYPDFEYPPGRPIRFCNDNIVFTLYDNFGDTYGTTSLYFFDIKDGTFLNSVPLFHESFFYEYLGGGYENILCKALIYNMRSDFPVEYSVLTVFNDFDYEFTDYTLQDAAIMRNGHMISEWELDLVCVDGEPEVIVPGSYREDDEVGFDTQSQTYMFPIDENRFVYRTAGYESMPGFGVYDFDTKTARDVPDSRDLLPIGIHDGKIYSEKTAWDGCGGSEIFVTDIETLETSLFTKFPYYLGLSDSIQYFMPENGKYIIALKEGLSDAPDFIYRMNSDTGETEYICKLPEDFYVSGGRDFIDDNTFVISSDSKLLILTVPD
ncbi:MAG: hypothetical protein J1E40_08540 [Oscillospiraceae bacterium]|nr:hypothetical protein [Oscillospiraceae bacterium]